MDLTPEQFEQAMSNAVKAVQDNVGKIILNGAFVASGSMQSRVFNRGITTAGNKMHYKNARYKILRTDAGLQINHKDLTFTGNLFNSLTILTADDKEVVYGFNNTEMAKIAGYQETSDKQVNEPIFDLSKKEIDTAEKAMIADVNRIAMSAIENFPKMPSLVPKQDKTKVKTANKKPAKKTTKIKPATPRVRKVKPVLSDREKSRISRAQAIRKGSYKPKKRKP